MARNGLYSIPSIDDNGCVAMHIRGEGTVSQKMKYAEEIMKQMNKAKIKGEAVLSYWEADLLAEIA